ncbi:MAG TPA: ATP-binding protein [Gaiellaceae bacterium]|nr:ATP-binding protein [Gaiellaceae bacterium]
MRLRARSVTLLAALVAGVLTDLVLMVPSLHFAYRSIPLHAMLEMMATLIAFLTMILLWGRLEQRRRLDDLLLLSAVAVFALTNLLFAAIPAAIWLEPHPFSTWTTLVGGGLGAALLAAASLTPPLQLRDYVKAGRIAVVGIALALLGIGIVVGALVEHLPIGIDPARSPVNVAPPIVGNEVIVIAQMVIAVFFIVAAVGFTQRAERTGDELLLWIGAGGVFAAFARVNYFIFPSLYSEWVYVGDAMRLMWHILLFIGAAREIQLYQRSHVRALLLDERRRIARNLHDGVAQELAFLAATARELTASEGNDGRLRQLSSAAERGLDESRRAIATLTRQQVPEPFDIALVQTVEEVAHRLGTHVDVEADPAPGLEADWQEQLLRIVREAVTNAARHGHAEHIRVSFRNGDGFRLRVEDDGSGFDPLAVDGSRFGLVTMRERAASLGGRLALSSSARGTEVEVTIP